MARTMKESGISWIGSIPSNWKIQKVKTAFYRSKEEAHIEDPVILSLARSGVKIRDISNNEGQLAESYYNYNPVVPGDLLLNPMDLYSGANCSVSKVSGVISPAYINLRTRGNYCPIYYDYYFKTQYWAMALFAHGKGVSFDNRWTLSPNDLFNYYIPVPEYDEQKKIADFLDRTCSEIDAIIDKTKATIEEYKALKQSVITDAVTKGVCGNRLMKNSEIDYLGEYPAEWNISSISNLFAFIGGYAFKSELFCDKTQNQVIRIGNIRNDELLTDSKAVYITDDYAEAAQACKVQCGDILFSMTGTKGKQDYFYTVHIKPEYIGDTDYYINQRVGCFRSKHSLDMQYYSYLLKVKRIKDYIFLFETGTVNQGNLGIETIKRTKLYLPPYEEQKAIAEYLDKKCAEIDALITQKTALLEELEAYKKSVIYEYVTGKKQVQ